MRPGERRRHIARERALREAEQVLDGGRAGRHGDGAVGAPPERADQAGDARRDLRELVLERDLLLQDVLGPLALRDVGRDPQHLVTRPVVADERDLDRRVPADLAPGVPDLLLGDDLRPPRVHDGEVGAAVLGDVLGRGVEVGVRSFRRSPSTGAP